MRHGLAAILLAGTVSMPAAAQSAVSLAPDAWTATDSLRSLTYLGRPALYINRGVALVRGAAMESGTLDLDVAASDTTNFLGVVFRAANPRFSNVVFLRPGASGTEEAVQYGPAFNSVGVAWQVYHGDGANAVADIPRNRWMHLRIELDGPVARLFVDTATAPTLVVPRVVESGGCGHRGLGRRFRPRRVLLQHPLLGRLADYFRRAPAPGRRRERSATGRSPTRSRPPTSRRPCSPISGRLTWQRVEPEPEGFVLVNRYREAPVGGVPRDSTGAVLIDSVMTGKIEGSRVVYARTTITAPRDEIRRLQYTYSNGTVIYLNGRPLAFAMNPGGLRGIGVMAMWATRSTCRSSGGRTSSCSPSSSAPEDGRSRRGSTHERASGGGGAPSSYAPGSPAAGMLAGARGPTQSELPKIAEKVNASSEVVTYRGVKAVKLDGHRKPRARI